MSLSLLAAFLIGCAFGGLAQRTHFCTMGAISDVVLFGSRRRLRGVLLAIAVAAPLVQALRLLGLPATPLAPAGWIGAGIGGLMFGFGMVLAGGCWSRNLVRLGSGSLKALVVVLVGGLSAAMLWNGTLAPVAAGIAAVLPWAVATPVGPLAGFVAALLLGAALAAYCFADPAFRALGREQMVGLGLGLLVALAWLVSASAPGIAGLTLAIPAADTVAELVGGGTGLMTAGPALVAGTVLGSFCAAVTTRELRIETFAARDDMIRHLIGGALLGSGGALAAGCTIGHGISGIAALLPASLLAASAMTAGAVWALRFLETGRLLPVAAPPRST